MAIVMDSDARIMSKRTRNITVHYIEANSMNIANCSLETNAKLETFMQSYRHRANVIIYYAHDIRTRNRYQILAQFSTTMSSFTGISV